MTANAEAGALTMISSSQISFDDETVWFGYGMSLVELWWAQVVRVAAIDPCPRLRIEWADQSGVGARNLGVAREKDRAAFHDRVVELMRYVEERFPHRVDRGWLDIPEVPWAPADEMPQLGEGPAAAGYRRAALPSERRGLAERRRPTGFDALLGWIGLATDAHPKRLVLTPGHLFAERLDGSVWRLPLSALRAARRVHGDTIFVFGRDTRVFLAARADCPIESGLRAALAGEDVTVAVRRTEAHPVDQEPPLDVADIGREDVEPVEWERAERFPRRGDDDETAFWNGPDPFEGMLQWLASSPDRPFDRMPRRVAVTPDHVVVQRRNGELVRLPLSSLRTRRTNGRDAVWVFGRDTELVLPHDEGSPFTAALEAALPIR